VNTMRECGSPFRELEGEGREKRNVESRSGLIYEPPMHRGRRGFRRTSSNALESALRNAATLRPCGKISTNEIYRQTKAWQRSLIKA
jgi:hypothetical protein